MPAPDECTPPSPDDLLQRNEDCLGAEFGEGLALLDLAGGSYYSLDPITSRVWELLAEPMSFRDLVDRLVEEYEVPRETCEEDVGALLARLAQRNLVAVEPGVG